MARFAVGAALSYEGWCRTFLLFRKPRFMSVGRSERVSRIRPLIKANYTSHKYSGFS